jgi:hypothetical protein
MKQTRDKIAKVNSRSRAVGVLTKCLADPIDNHARTNLDSACERILGVSNLLRDIHGAPVRKQKFAVRRLQDFLSRITPSTDDVKNCETEASKYIKATDNDICRELIGAKPGIDNCTAANQRLSQIKNEQHAMTSCAEYDCLEKFDSQCRSKIANQALEATATFQIGRPLLKVVNNACNKYRNTKLLGHLQNHMNDTAKWRELMLKAEIDKDSKCERAVANYMLKALNTEAPVINARKRCQAGEEPLFSSSQPDQQREGGSRYSDSASSSGDSDTGGDDSQDEKKPFIEPFSEAEKQWNERRKQFELEAEQRKNKQFEHMKQAKTEIVQSHSSNPEPPLPPPAFPLSRYSMNVALNSEKIPRTFSIPYQMFRILQQIFAQSKRAIENKPEPDSGKAKKNRAKGLVRKLKSRPGEKRQYTLIK